MKRLMHRQAVRRFARSLCAAPGVLAGALLLAACPDTNTDPGTVRPTARLEVFGTRRHNLDMDIVAGPERTSPAPEAQPYDPNDIRIRATGSQLDRGMGSIDLLVEALDPFECTWSSSDTDMGVVHGPASGPQRIHVTATHPPSGPAGIVMLEYDLREYVRQVGCGGHPRAEFNGRVRLVLTATNVGGLVTPTPPVVLYPCPNCWAR